MVGTTFSECTMRPVRILGGQWRGSSLRGANLSKLDLSGLDLREADLSQADLSGTLLRGTQLDGANLRRPGWRARTSSVRRWTGWTWPRRSCAAPGWT